ncbi:unnamed protein product, partial [Meganyctiphanes norvegica]
GYYAEEEELRQLQMMNDAKSSSASNDDAEESSNYPPRAPGRLPPPAQLNPNAIPVNVTTVPSKKPTSFPTSTGPMNLNKFSYIGPFVMGVGGFVIVAACVMTFEARDSAAKIVPARFRKPERKDDGPGVRNSSSQTKWEMLGLYGVDMLHQPRITGHELSRRAMTSAFIHFSKNLQSSMDSTGEYYETRGSRPQLVKCPSAPSLVRPFQEEKRHHMDALRVVCISPRNIQPVHQNHVRHHLVPNRLPRQAMSVDNPAVREVYQAGTSYQSFIGEHGDEDLELGASATGVHQSPSAASLALDLHLPHTSVTLAIRDQSRSPSMVQSHSPSIVQSQSPSFNLTTASDTSVADIHLETDLAVPGTSGISQLKLDKQTSTSDNISPKYSRSLQGSTSRRSDHLSTGGSFREQNKPRSNRKVRRSETIDTAANVNRQHRLRTVQGGHSASSLAGSTHSATEKRRLAKVRSDTAKRHQFLRQERIDTKEPQEDVSRKEYIDNVSQKSSKSLAINEFENLPEKAII